MKDNVTPSKRRGRARRGARLPLQSGQEQFAHDREGDDCERSAEHQRVIVGPQAREEEAAEAPVRDVCGERRRGHHLEHCRAQSAHDDGQSQRQLHAEDHLGGAHPYRRRSCGHGGVDGLDTRIGARQKRGNRQDDERDDRRVEPDPEDQTENRQQAEGRDRPRRADDGADEARASPRVADDDPDRQGDRGGDPDDAESEDDVLKEPRADAGRAPPVGRVGKPSEGREEIVHACSPFAPGALPALVHGVRSLPSRTTSPSTASARATVATTPVTTSAVIPR